MAARPDSPRSGAALGAAPVGATRPSALFAGVEPLEVFVELLAGIDTDTSSNEFYDRICEAICRLTTMRRAAIFLADAGRRRVRAVGSHGTSFEQLSALRPTLVNTPIAQRALLEDEVIVVSEQIEQAVPAEYARMLGITTLVCTPLSAAGRAYGVICADRGGGRFELSDGERHLLWTLGKTAALVATARNATRQQERARRLTERLDLAREIHERVLQRLFGVSLALSAEKALEPEERERCRVEMQEAVSDLRRALERPLAPLPPETGTTLEAELERLSSSTALPLTVDWQPGLMVPGDVEPLAQSVLAEALRNIAKHATAPQVQVSVACDTDTFTLEVRNDGARSDVRGAGMGLRLATFEALQHGGVLEFGPAREDSWRVRLVVPLPSEQR
jgi:signal transduction histidine kinase